MSLKISRYGWLPDLPIHRDFLYSAPAEMAGVLSSSVVLRAQCPSIYYNECAIEHMIDSDSGAQTRDGIKSVGKRWLIVARNS